jgi:UPF0716 family protein affecting phage T7 exclusion
VLPLLLLIAVTTVWGVTFVRVKDIWTQRRISAAMTALGILVAEPAATIRGLAGRS